MSAESAEQNQPVPGVASQETQEAFDTTPFEVAKDIVPERPETPVQLTEFIDRYNRAVQHAGERGAGMPPAVQEELLRRVAWRRLELGRLGLLGAGKLPSERTMSGIVEAMCGNPVVLAMIEEAFNRSNEPSSSDESAKPQAQA